MDVSIYHQLKEHAFSKHSWAKEWCQITHDIEQSIEVPFTYQYNFLNQIHWYFFVGINGHNFQF